MDIKKSWKVRESDVNIVIASSSVKVAKEICSGHDVAIYKDGEEQVFMCVSRRETI